LLTNLLRLVDQVLRLVQQAVEQDDQNKLAELIDSIENQSHVIEEFYSQNDDGKCFHIYNIIGSNILITILYWCR
jgi:hypothetical protein